MTGQNDTLVSVASPPSFADQVAAIDAIDVAGRIIAQGPRAAIGASTHEIVAMAVRLVALHRLADLTFDMLITVDQVPAVRTDPQALKALKALVDTKINAVGVSLEALGYGQPATEEEKTDGQG
jgi:hypothetical protein